MAILDQKQKKNLVFKFLQDDYNYREIQKRVHVSPGFITKVKKELLGDDYVFTNQPTKISKNTKAIDLIHHGKKPMEIALELNLDSNEVNKAYGDYFKLNNLDKFADLIKPENGEKFNLLLMVTNIFQQKGITDIDSILEILTKIKNIENLQKEINYYINFKLSFEHEIVRLESSVDELKNDITLKKSFCKYFEKELQTVKSEIVKEKETLEQLKRLCTDLYDIKAYENLQDTLITNIENVILDEDQFLLLIMVGVVEALKEDPQKRKSLYKYCKKFKNERLAVDNIDSRIAFFKSSEFWDDTSFYFHKLTEVYSEDVFAFVLKKYYKLYKNKQKTNSYN
jgi:hypothetical protein